MQTPPEANPLQRGEPAAFDRLFDQFAPRILGYLLRLTGSRAEAEDLTQETFLAAYHGRNAFRGSAKPLTWLLAIARRRWRDQHRYAKPPSVPLNENETATDDPADQIALSATLAKALEQLDEPEREVLLLTAVQGLTYKEAAEITGEPVGTVKWRVHEATQRLRRLLTAAEERYEARYGAGQKTETREVTRTTHPPVCG